MDENIANRIYTKRNIKKTDIQKELTRCLKFNRQLQEKVKQYILLVDGLIEQKLNPILPKYQLNEYHTMRSSRTYFKDYFPSTFYEENLQSDQIFSCVDNMKEILGRMNIWKFKNIVRLHNGVKCQNLKIELTPLLEKLKRISKKKIRTKVDLDEAKAIKNQVDIIKMKSDNELILNLKGLDFCKISSIYVPNMTPIRCQIRWITHEHPLVNHNEWLCSENLKLKELAIKFKEKNWDLISKYMDNGKSPIQCLVQYSSKLDSKLNESSFTSDEIQLISDILLRKNYEFGNFCDDYENIDSSFIYQYVVPIFPNKSFRSLQVTVESILDEIRSNNWTNLMDIQLFNMKKLYPNMSWKTISVKLKTNKSARQCQLRYENYLNPYRNMIHLSCSEQEKLIHFFNTHSYENLSDEELKDIIKGKSADDIKKAYFYLLNNGSLHNQSHFMDEYHFNCHKLDAKATFNKIKAKQLENLPIHVNMPDSHSNQHMDSMLFYYTKEQILNLTNQFYEKSRQLLSYIQELKSTNYNMENECLYHLLHRLTSSLSYLHHQLHPKNTENNHLKYAILEKFLQYPFKSYDRLINELDTCKHFSNSILPHYPLFKYGMTDFDDFFSEKINIDTLIDHYFGYLIDKSALDSSTIDNSIPPQSDLFHANGSAVNINLLLQSYGETNVGLNATIKQHLNHINRLLYHNELLLNLSAYSHFNLDITELNQYKCNFSDEKSNFTLNDELLDNNLS